MVLQAYLSLPPDVRDLLKLITVPKMLVANLRRSFDLPKMYLRLTGVTRSLECYRWSRRRWLCSCMADRRPEMTTGILPRMRGSRTEATRCFRYGLGITLQGLAQPFCCILSLPCSGKLPRKCRLRQTPDKRWRWRVGPQDAL